MTTELLKRIYHDPEDPGSLNGINGLFEREMCSMFLALIERLL